MSQPLFSRSWLIVTGLLSSTLLAQPVDVFAVLSHAVDHTTMLPGEILPFERVTLHARANGYVDSVLVDRGSAVRQGQLLVTLIAPELTAQTAEAESKVQSAESARAEAEARLAGLQATYERLKTASATPGAG